MDEPKFTENADLMKLLWRRRSEGHIFELMGMEAPGGVVLAQCIQFRYGGQGWTPTSAMTFVPRARIEPIEACGPEDAVKWRLVEDPVEHKHVAYVPQARGTWHVGLKDGTLQYFSENDEQDTG